jgi:Na+/glutamate symporter
VNGLHKKSHFLSEHPWEENIKATLVKQLMLILVNVVLRKLLLSLCSQQYYKKFAPDYNTIVLVAIMVTNIRSQLNFYDLRMGILGVIVIWQTAKTSFRKLNNY